MTKDSRFSVEVEEDPNLEGTNKIIIPAGLLSSGASHSIVWLHSTTNVCAALSEESTSAKVAGIDKYLRIFLGLRSVDKIEIEVAGQSEIRMAKAVTLAVPPGFMGPEVSKLVLRRLIGVPLSPGQKKPIYTATRTPNEIEVVKTEPDGTVLVTRDTALVFEPKPEQASRTGVSYSDIGGLHDELQQVRRIIEFPLRSPEMFSYLGIGMARGIILYGPPGTGKTLIARALCNEVGARFYLIQGPEIMSSLLGESEAKLRQIFDQARRDRPSVILIDELDAIAPKREKTTSEAERRIVATLLSQMDGLKEMTHVVVIGTTNRLNAIDAALRRPGRFEYEIHIGAPNLDGRKEILNIHTRGMPLEQVDIDDLAQKTQSFTGADIASLVREAAYCALERHFPEGALERGATTFDPTIRIRSEDFERARSKIKPSAMREITVQSRSELTWDSIGGLEQIRKQVMEIVQVLNDPQPFEQMGVKPPKGLLLYGRPGTGKSLIATAAANESGANLITVRGPEIRSKWFGESEERIRFIFSKAREVAPCVILLDELDALAPRKYGYSSESVDSITNQLLVDMDSLQNTDNILVIATTNQLGHIEPALLRSGRFDRQIEVPMPNLTGRKEIFTVHTKQMPLADEVNLEELATITEGMAGASISGVCRLAAMNALRSQRKTINSSDFHQAVAEIKHTEQAFKPPADQRMYG